MTLSLLNIPVEVLEKILSEDCLSYVDIIRLATVCKTIYTVTVSNFVWSRKFRQSWPTLRHIYNADISNWHQIFKECYECNKNIARELAELPAKYWDKDFLSDYCFDNLLNIAGKFGIQTVIELLRIIVTNEKGEANLTEKYYATKAVRVLVHKEVERKWITMMTKAPEEQLLENGAILISQWFQPHLSICETDIYNELDDITENVRCVLRKMGYSNLTVPLSIGTQELCDSLWNPRDCLTILNALNDVLFKLLGYHGNKHGYYNVENSFIDKVMQNHTGIPITMSIIYIAIARRLGVCCLPVNCPSHFLLKWRQQPGDTAGREFTFIDVFNGGTFLPPQPAHHKPVSKAPHPSVVFKRMLLNLHNIAINHSLSRDATILLQNTLELSFILDKDDVQNKMSLVNMYMQQGINEEKVESLLSEVPLTERLWWPYEPQMMSFSHNSFSRLRSENHQVEFSVGQIMTHKRYNYNCVIYGWDPVCAAGEEWIKEMNVRNLSYGEYQPFYHVLVDDGSNRYAAQENLYVSEEPHSINHPEVGRYFEKFIGIRYVPNRQLHLQYPEDG